MIFRIHLFSFLGLVFCLFNDILEFIGQDLSCNVFYSAGKIFVTTIWRYYYSKYSSCYPCYLDFISFVTSFLTQPGTNVVHSRDLVFGHT